MAQLNAYYDEGSSCREMDIQDVCEGKYFAVRHRTVPDTGQGGNVISTENLVVRCVE